MADMQQTRPTGAPGSKPKLTVVTNFLGAAASLALLIGIGVWGYKLVMRDVSGVPVVRAIEGPTREQPKEPGGVAAQHQGLSVNDVAAAGEAGGPAEQVVLAPAPIELTPEDEALSSVDLVTQDAQDAQESPAETEEATGLTSANPDVVQLAAVEDLATRLAEGVAPLSALAPLAEAEAATEEEIIAAIAAATGETPVVARAEDVDVVRSDLALSDEGLGQSLRPRVRPATIGAAADGTQQAAVPVALDVDPETIPVGTRLAQLGAYDSAEVAQAEWDRLNTRFGEYLEGKSRVIQKANSGGRTFYRLRAMGFADLSDARRFCSAFVAEKAECIPVVIR